MTLSFKNQKGLSLIEVIVYVALLGFVLTLIANFLIQITSAYRTLDQKREAASNARLILETLRNSIEAAREVYAPTSAFNRDLGQLSLVSAEGAGAGHATRYIDFWIDNGRLWIRREGSADETISSARVQVSKLYLERIMQGFGREAVKITLVIDPLNTRVSESVTLHSTFVLRGSY